MNLENHVDTTETITHLSLCSGYSGIGLGIKRVLPTLREVAHVEIEAYAVANLVKKMEESSLPPAPIFTNLKTFPFADFRGCVDILSGGFPCQPFSSAGKRLATEDPRHLFPYIAEGIRACRPRLVFLENVEGIISAKTGDGESVLQYVLRELEGLGYQATAGVFSASEVGASHQRKRVFILAVADTCINERRNICGSQPHSKLNGLGDNGGAELADTINEGSQRDNEAGGEDQQRRSSQEVWGATAGHCSKSFLPIARPGEQQYGHEEPRTKPKMDRTANGTSCRVDSLRMSGNGVVPATSELAFRTLRARLR